MRKHQKRVLTAVISCLLMLTLVISVPAILGRLGANKTEGSHTQTIVNRVDFLVKNTQYVFLKTEPAQDFEFTVAVSAKKTEADFYGVINTVAMNNFAYLSCLVNPADVAGALPLPDAPLPVVNGSPAAMTWNVFVTFHAEQAMDTAAELAVAYTSGVKAEVANKHLLPVDIQIKVLDQYPLLQILQQAEAYLDEHSGGALTPLKNAVNEGNRRITLAHNTSQSAVDAAYNTVQTELAKLA
ncbi:MAG: hypothetical protein LBS36_05070 [Oscillospiraceae bacterium]|jgi:hypothetical protein|nr:hypothetical protein [Oscillospiraceae bacterium]